MLNLEGVQTTDDTMLCDQDGPFSVSFQVILIFQYLAVVPFHTLFYLTRLRDSVESTRRQKNI